MSDHRAILDEEFEVLESIYPDELEKISDDAVRIRIEPDEPSASHPRFSFPPTYPDVIPEISIEPIDDDEGELTPEEEERVLEELRTIAEESVGMAMTFTIASAARETLSVVIRERLKREKEEDDRKTKEYEEIEARRTRGTPLTKDAFTTWRVGFMKELSRKRAQEEDERVKALPPKEREEFRKRRERLTGRQLFEQSAALATSDEALYEEGAAEVDMSQYTREAREAERRREEEEEEKRRKGLVASGDDSDGE